MDEPMLYRCPFCDFDRNEPNRDHPEWSAVQSLREQADKMRIARDGDTYSWLELPEHVRDYWREEASR